MTNTDSVSQWIHELKHGDDDAVDKLWNRYITRIQERARQLLRHDPTTVADEEDVAASVFESLRKGAVEGRFARLSHRDDLWLLLLVITDRKVVSHRRHYRRQKRGGNVRIVNEGAMEASLFPRQLSEFVGQDPSPDFLIAMRDELQFLLNSLRDDSLRDVVRWRMERYTNDEIAEKLNITTRAVERKLGLIRQSWTSTLRAVSEELFSSES